MHPYSAEGSVSLVLKEGGGCFPFHFAVAAELNLDGVGSLHVKGAVGAKCGGVNGTEYTVAAALLKPMPLAGGLTLEVRRCRLNTSG